MRSPNEDLVLQSFYQERQTRPRTPKTHSLLQKNMSFFSNSCKPQDENLPPSSSKYLQRKNKLQEYEKSYNELTSTFPANKKTQESDILTDSKMGHTNIDPTSLIERIESKYSKSANMSCNASSIQVQDEEETFRKKPTRHSQ